MAIVRGLGIAFGIFALSFALHIVGGASDQEWLFALAVALIYFSATGLPVIAAVAAGRSAAPFGGAALLVPAGLLGVVFTGGALWAVNGRTAAWWQPPVAVLLVGVMSAVGFALLSARQRNRSRNAGSRRLAA